MLSNKSIDQFSNILLVDSSITITEFNNLKKTFKKVFTFDINSDRLFTEKKIQHEIADNFINNTELALIDSACIDFCQWHNENNGNDMLSHDGINLGSLFKVEFHNFLIPFVKTFLIINRILEKFPDAKFFCSPNIFQIAKKLGTNVKPITEKSSKIQLTWDKIQYNFGDSISVKISKEHFQKLKKLSEIVAGIFSKKNNSKNLEKSYALVEFDLIKYEKIFQESNNFKGKTYLYNKHRPVIYNFKSLKILRNSHIIPHITSKNSIENIRSEINLSHNKIRRNFQKFLDDTKFFNSFFQFQGISFWLCLKPYLTKFFNKKILDSIYEIEYAKKFLLENNLSSLIILSESGFTEQIMLKLAKKFSINTILLQHGVMLDNPSAVNYNKIVAGILPIEADKFFVWGDISYEYAIQLNYPDHKIEITGNPNLDRIFEQKKKCVKKSNTVLLLATGPRDQQSVGHNVNEWKKYENLIKQICTVITKHNLNLIIKRHPDIAESDFSQQIHNEFSNVKILKHSEIIDLLLISKIVISVGISSAIFEAQILEKPVISIIADHDVYGSPKNVSHSCLETTVDNFEMNFLKLVTNSQFYQKIIRNGNEIMEKNIRYIGNSSKIILDSLGKS